VYKDIILAPLKISVQWVTEEYNTDLGSQNPSRSPKAIKVQLKSNIFQFRKH
jgi:hypothetical protein